MVSLPIGILREHTSSLANHILNCSQAGHGKKKERIVRRVEVKMEIVDASERQEMDLSYP